MSFKVILMLSISQNKLGIKSESPRTWQKRGRAWPEGGAPPAGTLVLAPPHSTGAARIPTDSLLLNTMQEEERQRRETKREVI